MLDFCRIHNWAVFFNLENTFGYQNYFCCTFSNQNE
jgi:hypothetical protein